MNFWAKHLIKFGFVLTIIVTSCHKEDVNVNDLSGNKDSGSNSITNDIDSKSHDTKSYSGDYVFSYFNMLCRIAQTTPGFFPPQVARAYGYVGIANYESVVYGIKKASTLAGQLNGLTTLPTPDFSQEYNWAISSNAAMADMMRKMFDKNLSAANSTSIDSMENVTLSSLSAGVSNDVVGRSIQYGKSIAAAIYQYSTTDGGHEAYLDPFQLPFTIPPDDFCWSPTGAVTTPVSPRWGNNRPFIQADIDKTVPPPHIPFSTATNSDFYKQAMMVYNQGKTNTPEQITIAKYWADDPFNTCTPTGHTFNILTQLLKENKATLEKVSVAYARLAIAENDAFIACWKGKYKYVLLRPVTYIKKYIDPGFTTTIGTPPFPSYTSGHSCEMGAGSKIFIDMFTNGSGKYNFTDESQLQYGFMPRTYPDFNTMAEECAKSRFYGGLHYPMDNDNGLTCGRAIGDNVNTLISWPKEVK